MNKCLVVLLTCAGLCFALQYSLRIQALGTDFAYLIPDYETDVYNNPNLMGEKLNGISYEPVLSAPVTMCVLTKRFGWFGNYWASYRYNHPHSGFGNVTSILVDDLWLLDLRGKFWKFLTEDVWSLYNDGSYYEMRDFNNQDDYDTTRTIKYIYSATGADDIGKYISIIYKVCTGYYGYYRTIRYYGDELRIDQRQLMHTGRVGVYYQKTPSPNTFTSFYLTVGGPVSTLEIDNLPYSVFSHLRDDEIQQTFFAKTLITQLGWAKSFSIDERGFVAIALRDVLLYQRTNTPDTSFTYHGQEMRGLRNTLSFPIALEYNIGDVALRIGTRFYYMVRADKEWNSDSMLALYNEHNLGFGYTWGIGWCVNEHLRVDFYNTSNLASKNNWAIYLRRVW